MAITSQEDFYNIHGCRVHAQVVTERTYQVADLKDVDFEM